LRFRRNLLGFGDIFFSCEHHETFLMTGIFSPSVPKLAITALIVFPPLLVRVFPIFTRRSTEQQDVNIIVMLARPGQVPGAFRVRAPGPARRRAGAGFASSFFIPLTFLPPQSPSSFARRTRTARREAGGGDGRPTHDGSGHRRPDAHQARGCPSRAPRHRHQSKYEVQVPSRPSLNSTRAARGPLSHPAAFRTPAADARGH